MTDHHKTAPEEEHGGGMRKKERRLRELLLEALGAREKAAERLQRAEERLQKHLTRVQRIEARLVTVRQQQADAGTSLANNAIRMVTENSLRVVEEPMSPLPSIPKKDTAPEASKRSSEEAVQLAQQARAAASAAELAARLAAQRAQQAEQHIVETDVFQRPSIEELLANEPPDIVTLDQEEETLAMIASMRTADVAAAAAAAAEAEAEASSVRTREARQAVEEADRFLQQVRGAIATGVLTDEDANSALHYAEREATYAHAALADAEAAEEHARRAAMNAEAEAEVAEGMSFAVEQRGKYEEHLRAVEHEQQSESSSRNGTPQSHPQDEDETIELPIIRPKESR